MLHFFKKPKNTSLDWMGVDIHSHLLPGIDDGSSSIETSAEYIKQLYELGLTKFICTPHIFKELYPNNKHTISSTLELLRNFNKIKALNVDIRAAAEYMIDSDFDGYLTAGDMVCLPDSYILIEMSYIAENPNIENYIFNLNIKGYKPILAHPERYSFYHSNFEKYKKLKELGCLFQLNLLSITGYYGRDVKMAAIKLINEELIDLIGTDLHHNKHLNTILEFVKSGKAWSTFSDYPFKNRELFF